MRLLASAASYCWRTLRVEAVAETHQNQDKQSNHAKTKCPSRSIIFFNGAVDFDQSDGFRFTLPILRPCFVLRIIEFYGLALLLSMNKCQRSHQTQIIDTGRNLNIPCVVAFHTHSQFGAVFGYAIVKYSKHWHLKCPV